MKKSIYEEALLKLREIAEKLTRKQWFELTNNIELIRRNLQQAQKQEKLLNKIKEIIDRQDDSYISSMLEESQRYYEIKELMIKELENDK